MTGTAPGMDGAMLKPDAAEAAVRTSLESGVAARDSVNGAGSMASADGSQPSALLPIEPQRPKVRHVTFVRLWSAAGGIMCMNRS